MNRIGKASWILRVALTGKWMLFERCTASVLLILEDKANTCKTAIQQLSVSLVQLLG